MSKWINKALHFAWLQPNAFTNIIDTVTKLCKTCTHEACACIISDLPFYCFSAQFFAFVSVLAVVVVVVILIIQSILFALLLWVSNWTVDFPFMYLSCTCNNYICCRCCCSVGIATEHDTNPEKANQLPRMEMCNIPGTKNSSKTNTEHVFNVTLIHFSWIIYYLPAFSQRICNKSTCTQACIIRHTIHILFIWLSNAMRFIASKAAIPCQVRKCSQWYLIFETSFWCNFGTTETKYSIIVTCRPALVQMWYIYQ